MKKILIILSAIFFTTVNNNIEARDFNSSKIFNDSESDKWDYLINHMNIGANFGFSVPSMIYSGQQYDFYKKTPLFSGMGGIFVEWNFYGNLSLKPYMNFVGRGVHMKYSPLYIDYRLKATYFDLRLPVVYSFNTGSEFEPYMALGPSLNFSAGGKAFYTSGSMINESYSLKLNKGNFKPFDFGVFLGAGFNYPVSLNGFRIKVGAEIGYNLGMIDTFSKAEKNKESIAINLPEYSIQGSRKNHNLSFTLNVTIPLKSIFGKRNKGNRQEVQVYSTYSEPTVKERKVTIQEKQCCSLDEMYDMILGGEDISMKKVCAFSDITFDFDKATIRPESKEYLDKFVTVLMKFQSIKLSIIGHTDNIGDSQYNLQLSRKRAEAVAQYFIKSGIDSGRLRCYGYGSRQPLTDNSNPQARAMNRRVEFDIVEGAF